VDNEASAQEKRRGGGSAKEGRDFFAEVSTNSKPIPAHFLHAHVHRQHSQQQEYDDKERG